MPSPFLRKSMATFNQCGTCGDCHRNHFCCALCEFFYFGKNNKDRFILSSDIKICHACGRKACEHHRAVGRTCSVCKEQHIPLCALCAVEDVNRFFNCDLCGWGRYCYRQLTWVQTPTKKAGLCDDCIASIKIQCPLS